MIKSIFSLQLVTVPFILILAGCGRAPAVLTTPDLCAAGNIEVEVNKVHAYMREFDDASALAASLPREQIGDAIANLQRIRRAAEDESIPACLAVLKTTQIAHMNSVINTLIAFLGGGDQTAVNQGIQQARQLHDQYTLELARLLGLTVEPATAIILPTGTPAP